MNYSVLYEYMLPVTEIMIPCSVLTSDLTHKIPLKNVLLDSGASKTIIYTKLAEFLGLELQGEKIAYTASGTLVARKSAVNIVLESMPQVFHIDVWVADIPNDMILGLDFLQAMDRVTFEKKNDCLCVTIECSS